MAGLHLATIAVLVSGAVTAEPTGAPLPATPPPAAASPPPSPEVEAAPVVPVDARLATALRQEKYWFGLAGGWPLPLPISLEYRRALTPRQALTLGGIVAVATGAAIGGSAGWVAVQPLTGRWGPHVGLNLGAARSSFGGEKSHSSSRNLWVGLRAGLTWQLADAADDPWLVILEGWVLLDDERFERTLNGVTTRRSGPRVVPAVGVASLW